MTWTVPTPSPVDGPLTGDDRPILEGYLNWQRVTLLNICAGLTGEQLARRPIPSSNLSLLGLIRHLAKVERIWFRQRAASQPVPPMYDPALGKDADFNYAVAADAEADLARLRAEWQQAEAAVAGLVHGRTLARGPSGRDRAPLSPSCLLHRPGIGRLSRRRSAPGPGPGSLGGSSARPRGSVAAVAGDRT